MEQHQRIPIANYARKRFGEKRKRPLLSVSTGHRVNTVNTYQTNILWSEQVFEEVNTTRRMAQQLEKNQNVDKELAHYKELTVQQQKKIDCQAAKLVKLAGTIKETEREIKSLRLDNVALQHELKVMEAQVVEQETDFATHHLTPEMLDLPIEDLKFFGLVAKKKQQEKLFEKNREKQKKIEELEKSIKDIRQKYSECFSEKRQLQKEKKELEGFAEECDTALEKQDKELNTCKMEMRKLKLEKREESRYVPKPHLVKKPQTTVQKSKSKICLGSTVNRSPSHSAQKLEMNDMVPLRGVQIRPPTGTASKPFQPLSQKTADSVTPEVTAPLLKHPKSLHIILPSTSQTDK